MGKAIIYWLMPETYTEQQLREDENLWPVFADLDAEFTRSFQMPGTRTQEGWQAVNMLSTKPEDKNSMFVALKQRFADVGWDVRKFDIPLNWNAVKVLLRNAPPQTLFFFMWHYPVLVPQYRQNGTPVLVGEVQKKVMPVYDPTPGWFIEFLADVVIGGTPEEPIMGRPTEVPQLNKWVHQESFSELAEVVDEIVPDNTPDE